MGASRRRPRRKAERVAAKEPEFSESWARGRIAELEKEVVHLRDLLVSRQVLEEVAKRSERAVEHFHQMVKEFREKVPLL